MPKTAESRLRLKALDKMSGVFKKVTASSRVMGKFVKLASKKFQIMKARTRGLSRSLNKTSKSMRRVGAGMTLGLTAPIVAFGASAVNSATQFQGSMNKVEALTGATGKSLDAMRKQAKQLGASTQFSATQAADAMAFFGQAGFDANEILKATPATLSLAAASSTDLATSADILSNVMGGFNVRADMAGKFVDVLALATAKGNVNMLQISETMKDAAPVAQKFGASIEETAALTAKLGDAGIQGTKAGTTLKNMFLNLSSPTKRIKDLMGSLGVKAVDPATKKMRSMTDILVDMNKSFEAKGIKGAKKLAILNEIFGKRAIAGAGVLLDAVSKIDATTGINSVKKLTMELENSEGAALKMQKTMQKGLPGAFKALKSSFEGLQLAVLDLEFGGKKLSTRIVELVNKITGFFQSLSKNHPGMLKFIVIIGAVVAILGPLIAGLGLVIAIVPSLVTGFGLISAGLASMSISASGLVLAMLPVIAAIITFAALAFVVWDNWKPIKKFFSDFFDHPLDTLKEMVKWLGKVSGISSLFGFGDKKAAEKKAKIIGPEKGDATNARVKVKESTQNKLRQRKAMLDVNFSNMPIDTRVTADDRDGLLDSMTGMMAIGG